MVKYLILIAFSLLICGCDNQNPKSKFEIQNLKSKFEKVTFQTTWCLGNCPSYHLEIDKNKKIKLYAQVYKASVLKTPMGLDSSKLDLTKTGYFIGTLNEPVFDQLINELETIGLETIEFDGSDCCDGSVITIIVYYDGKRKFLKSMDPPHKADNLISIFEEICRTSILERSNEKFNNE